MKPIFTHVLATMLLVSSGSSVAAGADGMSPHVSVHKISLAAYQGTYENLGSSKDVPKIIVYSPAGECVGIATGKTLRADGFVDFVSESLRKHQKACGAVLSDQLGVTKPGPDAGTGKPEVYLIVFDVPFCTACKEFKSAVRQASDSALPNVQFSIQEVDLSSKN